MILEKLFPDISTFREYVPYLESNITFADLESNAKSARKQICAIVSVDVYNEVLAKENSSALDELRTAMANLILGKQVVFDAVNRRKQDIDIYKHEQESMRRGYMENYCNAMDSLIQLLEQDDAAEAKWKNTKYHKMLSGLRIKTAAEFDSIYPIDGSFLFFFRTVPFQQEALDDYLKGYYDRVKESDEDMIQKLDRCLAKLTVAISLRQFDILELPSTVRNLFDDTTASRNGKDEQNRVLQLSELLLEEARQFLQTVDVLLAESESGNLTDYGVADNQPDDKFYFMT